MTLDTNREQTVTVHNGWVLLPILILFGLGSLAGFIYSIATSGQNGGHPNWWLFVGCLLGMILFVVLMQGFFTLQPNEARVLLLFGKYKGTVRQSGFHWGNPFYSNGPRGMLRAALIAAAAKEKSPEAPVLQKRGARNKISLRVRNLNSDRLKVKIGRAHV